MAVGQRPHLGAHAQTSDHGPRHTSDLFYIIGSAGGNIVKDQFLSRASTKSHGKRSQHLFAGHQDTIFVRAEPCHATGLAATHDGHFLNGIGFGDGIRYHGMTSFMVGNDALLFIRDQTGFAFGSHHDALDRLFQFGLTNGLLVAAGSKDRSFVYQVFQICPDKTRSAAGYRCEIRLRI